MWTALYNILSLPPPFTDSDLLIHVINSHKFVHVIYCSMISLKIVFQTNRFPYFKKEPNTFIKYVVMFL